MFFFLSKTVSYLVMPFTIIFVVLILSAFLKNMVWRRRCFWTGIGLLVFFSNDFIANEAMHAWELPTVAYKDMQPHALGIVLTGSTVPFLKPDDRVYFHRGADRVTHTVQLYSLGLIKKILISGGSGMLLSEDEPEANKFRKAMIMMGVAPEDIYIENETRNTYESAVAVKPMLDSLHYEAANCLLITSAFHMRRSLACYHKAGVDLQPFTTDFYSHPRVWSIETLLLPKLDAIAIWQKLFKEWIGLAAYKAAGYI
ncbi:YdcF family protein [Chryseolinea lacunae]|uniref:YdcF family protein n=1 Tax=Chryseolinea lacunae TaxID=2801331 RepID=A0ABS1KWP1_9BACT|nr:YdcF family protein [Chryseolinea lacunae]MBL0743865.1 YdcF family protein [Chryseolinea lacunae]